MQLNVLKNPKLWICILFFPTFGVWKQSIVKPKLFLETKFWKWISGTLWLFGVLESRMKSIFKSWFLGISWLWLNNVGQIHLPTLHFFHHLIFFSRKLMELKLVQLRQLKMLYYFGVKWRRLVITMSIFVISLPGKFPFPVFSGNLLTRTILTRNILFQLERWFGL